MKEKNGFTLIELMLTVAILGILASIAIPAYNNYVREADRSVAKTDLLEIAQIMERNFTVNRTYSTGIQGPDGSGLYSYTISIVAAPINYRITANITGSRDNVTLRLDGLGTQEMRTEDENSEDSNQFTKGWP